MLVFMIVSKGSFCFTGKTKTNWQCVIINVQ